MSSTIFVNHAAGRDLSALYSYSQAAKLPNGTVILSGMIGIPGTSLEEQITAILNHIEAALLECAAKPADVYKLVSYHTEVASIKVWQHAWAGRTKNQPTSTAVGVASLAIEGLFLEVQVEAWRGP
jgi:enamine deaminase RidA (YjgF/YER057c/UK114 family)